MELKFYRYGQTGCISIELPEKPGECKIKSEHWYDHYILFIKIGKFEKTFHIKIPIL